MKKSSFVKTVCAALAAVLCMACASCDNNSDSLENLSEKDYSSVTLLDVSERLSAIFPYNSEIVVSDIKEAVVEFDDSKVFVAGKYSISSRLYYYLLSYNKTDVLGSAITDNRRGEDTEEFWESVYDNSGITNKDYVIREVDKFCKNLVRSMLLLDKLGLEETDSAEETRKNLISESGFGSEEAFNKYYAAYGLTLDIYIEYVRYEAAMYQIYDYLFGKDGIDAITEDEAKQYFDENYVKFRSTMISFYKADENGYSVPKTEEEIIKIKSDCAGYLVDIKNGVHDFDYYTYLNEDYSVYDFPNGYIVKEGDMDDSLIAAAKQLEIGECAVVETNYGVHIIKREEIGGTDFEDTYDSLLDTYYLELHEQYYDSVDDSLTVNREVKEKYDFYDVILS